MNCETILAILFLVLTSSRIVNGKIWKGYYAVSEPVMYKDAYNVIHSSHLLKHIYVPEVWRHSPIRFCNDECLKYDGLCKTFLYHYKIYRCSLYKHSNCDSFTHLERPKIGYVQYDVRNGNEVEASDTCFNKCIKDKEAQSNTCGLCGRFQNCLGPRCSEPCVRFCWELEPQVHSGVYFSGVLSSGGKKYVACVYEWQLIYRGPTRSNVLQYYDSFSGLKVLLKISIYSNSESRYSIFNESSFSASSLTVGNFVSGDAGNFWNAPFVGRTFFTPNNTQCFPFFYQKEVCDHETNFTSDQFIWTTENLSIDTFPITLVMLHVSNMTTP